MTRITPWLPLWLHRHMETIITICGILLVTVSLTAITLDLLDMYIGDVPAIEQPEPAAFLADWIPTSISVCSSAPTTLTEVNESIELFNTLGWPIWPTANERLIECSSLPAPTGSVRIHSCNDLRLEDGLLIPPCEPNGDTTIPAAVTYVQLSVGDTGFPIYITSADIYLSKNLDVRFLEHEMGHARGLITPGAYESHSTDEDNLMAIHPGTSLKWLDRRPNGDWPW